MARSALTLGRATVSPLINIPSLPSLREIPPDAGHRATNGSYQVCECRRKDGLPVPSDSDAPWHDSDHRGRCVDADFQRMGLPEELEAPWGAGSPKATRDIGCTAICLTGSPTFYRSSRMHCPPTYVRLSTKFFAIFADCIQRALSPVLTRPFIEQE